MSTRNGKVLYLEIGQPGGFPGQVFKFNFLTLLTGLWAGSEQLNLSNCWIGQGRLVKEDGRRKSINIFIRDTATSLI